MIMRILRDWHRYRCKAGVEFPVSRYNQSENKRDIKVVDYKDKSL